MITIDDAAYETLVQKADAWDRHVNRRLTGGGSWALADMKIEVLRGSADIIFKNCVVRTPFGQLPMKNLELQKYYLHTGDIVNVAYDVRLTIGMCA